MRYRHILAESVTKRPWTFYHGSNSAAFQQFDPTQAAKGEQYWNPLGHGMYATNNPRFAGEFGSNVYKVLIPAGSSYRRMNQQTWQNVTGEGVVMRALARAFKKKGQRFDRWSDSNWAFRRDLQRVLSSNDPYTSLHESAALVQMHYPDFADAYEAALPEVTNATFGKFDFVVFTDTNDPIGFNGQPTWEVVIFNPALQKAEPIDREEWRTLRYG